MISLEFEVKPYLIYSLNEEETTIVQTRESSFATKSAELIEFLSYLEINKIEKISFEDMITMFGSHDLAQSSIEFLLSYSILKPFQTKYLTKKEEITFFSNDDSFNDLVNIFWKDRNVDSQELKEFELFDKENNLVIVSLNPFSLKQLKEIVSLIKKDSSNIYKFIFPYGHGVYLSNYYSPLWGNPCPLCFFYSIESYLRGSQTGKDNLNFQVMVDLFYKEKGTYEYNGLLKLEDWLPVFSQLNKDFNLEEDVISEVDDVLKIDLVGNTLSYDTCYLWEMCDCYE
ncbi:McbB family protein [Enterococcus caccae]|uniref:McbB family protein n=1 Tax=Enterococcus caccae TaxID=317735 RepID=UPI000920AAC6|nr:McbB family protein [Enterococcus caccae]OJG26722.1 hypothetical protein RU98_GL000512 [Enterococcus caccae]